MTVLKSIKCDDIDCTHSINVDDCDTVDLTMRSCGWQQDPEDPWLHYCPVCWDKIKEKYKE